jgi:hypothetical protein
MKNYQNLQTVTGSDNLITDPGHFSSNELGKKKTGYASKLLPATGLQAIGPVGSIRKLHDNEAGSNPFFNKSLQQVAARLSEIEMALDCYDKSGLQFSIYDLKNQFLDMKISSVFRLARQMEELADENQFLAVKELLLETKKVIGSMVKHRIQFRD